MHESAVNFGKVAEEYERGRPGYPAEAVDWVIKQASLGPGRVVVDLAAGTGKLTRELTRSGARVIAVEPLAEMRAQFRQAVPGVEVLEGFAEDMPLASATADAVTIAAAFHWFSTDQALAEIARVLREDGRLFLLWNRREQNDPLQAAITAIIEEKRGDAPAHSSRKWRGVLEASPLFLPDGELRTPSCQEVDSEQMADRFASVSFVASLPEEERQQVARLLRALVPEGERVRLEYVTEVSCWVRSGFRG